MEQDKKKILLATGDLMMDSIIEGFNDFEVIGVIEYREEIFETCHKISPDILVVAETIGGKKSLTNILLQTKSTFSNLRIVYFCGSIDYNDIIRVNNLNALIQVGINDIISDSKLNDSLIHLSLTNEREKESNDIIISKSMPSIYGKRRINPLELVKLKNIEDVNSNIYPQLFTFISSKSGVGNTFIISNIAVALANMGLNNVYGSKPRIALIDLDFVGFNLSNNFDTLNNSKNIFEAINLTRKIITDNGLVDNKRLQMQVIENIKKMFIPTKKYSNIKILCGPNKFYENDDINYLTHDDLVFILDSIVDDYDIILVDAKCDIEFNETFPLFSLSKNIYSTLEMTYNSLFNNHRLNTYLQPLLSEKKIRYILNKDLNKDVVSLNSDDLKSILNYDFIARIPYIDPILIFNNDYKKDFIINLNDKNLLYTRYELIKIANDIWPIKNFNKLESKFNEIDMKNEEINIKKELTFIDELLLKLGIKNNSKENLDKINDVVHQDDFLYKIKNLNLKEILLTIKKGLSSLYIDLKNKTRKTDETENTQTNGVINNDENTEANEIINNDENTEANEIINNDENTEANETINDNENTEADETINDNENTEADETINDNENTEADETINDDNNLGSV